MPQPTLAPAPSRPAAAPVVRPAPPPAAPSAPEPPAATHGPAILQAKPGTPVSTPAALAPLWGKVIRSQGISPILRAILTNSSLVSLDGGKATIVCAPKFASGAPKWSTQIADLLSREHGSPVEVALRAAASDETIETPPPDAATIPSPDGADPAAAPAPAPRVNVVQAADHPLVKQAIELFGGRVVDVQPRRH